MTVGRKHDLVHGWHMTNIITVFALLWVRQLIILIGAPTAADYRINSVRVLSWVCNGEYILPR